MDSFESHLTLQKRNLSGFKFYPLSRIHRIDVKEKGIKYNLVDR